MPERLIPELLAPAGSPEALEAAFAAGADAVYLGGTRHNARMNAHNFDATALREAVTHAHRVGGRVYLTLNTLIYDRELAGALEAAYEAASAGVDGLIVADMGAAALIRRALPNLPLHASTQLSGHNRDAGGALAPFGFSRYVIARETSLADLAAAVRDNPLEVEVFIHGALCVSHSGQCLFSSLVGGRSGNRGECAQPCRLPYAAGSCDGCARSDRSNQKPRHNKENYPLSLKDLTLAAHVPALIDAGIASLKIEGRMKSPAYVGGVVSIWRKLLDERRAATPDEMAALADLFSREGFTDGYQIRKIDDRMLGVRSEDDKDRTAAAERRSASLLNTARGQGFLPLRLSLRAKAGDPVSLTATAPLYRQGNNASVTVEVTGDAPDAATNPAAALTAESAQKQLSKTGGTPYRVTACDTNLGDGLLLPLSRLNALRREALDKLESARMAAMPDPTEGYAPAAPDDVTDELRAAPAIRHGVPRLTARFSHPKQITAAARDYFDLIFLPLGHPLGHRRAAADLNIDKAGLILPPVIFDREAAATEAALAEALASGVRHLLVGNVGHLPLVRRAAERADVPQSELVLHGDFRLNVTNSLSALREIELGFSDLLLSPELTLPRLRDVALALTEGDLPSRAGAVVYGRIPLMLLEKCAIRALYRHLPPSTVCRTVCARDAAVMQDRMGKAFPVLRESGANESEHRNVVYNSLPVGMSDRAADLDRAALGHRHFLFSTESPDEVDRVIEAYRNARPLGGEVRRIK